MIDRSSLMESLSHSWTSFNEDKRSGGPLGYGSNQTAAFLAQFALFFWGFSRFLKRKKLVLISYGIISFTLLATMYCFSRGAYLAVIVSVIVLGIVTGPQAAHHRRGLSFHLAGHRARGRHRTRQHDSQ